MHALTIAHPPIFLVLTNRCFFPHRSQGDEEEVKVYAYEGERVTPGEIVPVTAGEDPKVLTKDVELLGARSGEGKATFPNGDVYQGGFADGSRSGLGSYSYAAAAPAEDEEPKPPIAAYEGKWSAGEKDGVGLMTYESGAKYHGAFKGGKFNGQGTMFYANGDIYCGEWVDGKKSGTGTYCFKASGAKVQGTWVDNKLTTGAFIDKFGNAFTGSFDSTETSTTYAAGGFTLCSGAVA